MTPGLIPVSPGKCLRCGHDIICPFCPNSWCHTCTDCACYDEYDCVLPPEVYDSWVHEVNQVMERLNITRWPPLSIHVLAATEDSVTVEYDGEPDATANLSWDELRKRSVTTSTEEMDRYHAEAYNQAFQQAEALVHNRR